MGKSTPALLVTRWRTLDDKSQVLGFTARRSGGNGEMTFKVVCTGVFQHFSQDLHL